MYKIWSNIGSSFCARTHCVEYVYENVTPVWTRDSLIFFVYLFDCMIFVDLEIISTNLSLCYRFEIKLLMKMQIGSNIYKDFIGVNSISWPKNEGNFRIFLKSFTLLHYFCVALYIIRRSWSRCKCHLIRYHACVIGERFQSNWSLACTTCWKPELQYKSNRAGIDSVFT